jgi:hypothetical protein
VHAMGSHCISLWTGNGDERQDRHITHPEAAPRVRGDRHALGRSRLLSSSSSPVPHHEDSPLCAAQRGPCAGLEGGQHRARDRAPHPDPCLPHPPLGAPHVQAWYHPGTEALYQCVVFSSMSSRPPKLLARTPAAATWGRIKATPGAHSSRPEPRTPAAWPYPAPCH